MFYEERPESILRFGDIITDLVEYAPILNALPNATSPHQLEYTNTKYYSVMSPCCSIEDKVLLVCPLRQVRANFADNEYLFEDFTRINREMEPTQTVSSEVWEKFSAEKKAEMLAKGKVFSFIELFVYEKSDLLDEYSLTSRGGRKFKTRHYMIDFRNTYNIRSNAIVRGNDLSGIKRLQLSVSARKELRDKVTFFYSRVPAEDKIE